MSMRRLIKAAIPRRLFAVVAPYGHLVEAMVYNCLYGFPARGMKVIGVTGTNGKTTTSFLIHRMLQSAGYKTGLMTTVAWAMGDEVQLQTQHMTNVPVPLLMRRLRAMRAAGVEWLVLETTSHALVQYRTWGIPYSVAVLTNISRDHLDYHKTMERYIAAKQRLFGLAQRNRRGLQMGIANADDQQGAGFAAITQNSIMYGIEAGDVRAANIRMDANGIAFEARAQDETYAIASHLPGSFNVYNCLAAVCVGRAVGLSREQIEQGIAALPGVAGRLEAVDAGQKFAVVVDYAHTPDALSRTLTTARALCSGQVSVVFGAGGGRDRSKRPLLGAAARAADHVYLTSDNPRFEEPLAIIAEIEGGLVGHPSVVREVDRARCIELAVRSARADDWVLIAGKGHEQAQESGGATIAFSDEAIVQGVRI
jgi:UDP-N-acetylmuramoyl-L-alanyl-D-glutamate--2,6-diaminopimelate ligase